MKGKTLVLTARQVEVLRILLHFRLGSSYIPEDEEPVLIDILHMLDK